MNNEERKRAPRWPREAHVGAPRRPDRASLSIGAPRMRPAYNRNVAPFSPVWSCGLARCGPLRSTPIQDRPRRPCEHSPHTLLTRSSATRPLMISSYLVKRKKEENSVRHENFLGNFELREQRGFQNKDHFVLPPALLPPRLSLHSRSADATHSLLTAPSCNPPKKLQVKTSARHKRGVLIYLRSFLFSIFTSLEACKR